MRSIAFFFCFLAAARLSVLCAPVQSQHSAVVARKNAGGGGPPPSGFTFTETFEAAGYDLTKFTSQFGSPDPNYATSPAPLIGSKSLSIPSGATAATNTSLFDLGEGVAEVSGSAVVYMSENSDQSSFKPIYLYNDLANASTDANVVAYVGVTAGAFDQWSSNVGFTVGTGSVQTAAINSALTNTLYYIWFRYKQGTGSNAEFEFRYNTTDNYAGATTLLTTDGARTDKCRFIRFNSPGTVLNRVIWDSVTISGDATLATTSYANSGGTGNRTGSITASASAGLMSGTGGLPVLIDGTATSGAVYFTGSFAVGPSVYMRYDFGTARLITEATWKQQSGTTHGVWKWQGSADASTWTDIGSSFTLHANSFTETASTSRQLALNGNTTAYRYYQMVGVSGTTSSSPFLYEIQFKID